jgi:son of sevenless-like protein
MNAAVSAALASLDPSDTRRSPTMRGPQTEAIRRSLHLSIDPTPYREATSSTSDSSPSPILSTRASVATTNTTYSVVPADDECRICSVFCLFDYWSDDPDHLSFRKGDFLDIVKQEETGWWAAMRPGGNRVGWIPCGYVQTLADDTAKTIARVDSAILMWSPEEKQSRPVTIRRNSELPAADVSSRNEWDSGDADEEHVRGPPLMFITIAHSGNRIMHTTRSLLIITRPTGTDRRRHGTLFPGLASNNTLSTHHRKTA